MLWKEFRVGLSDGHKRPAGLQGITGEGPDPWDAEHLEFTCVKTHRCLSLLRSRDRALHPPGANQQHLDVELSSFANSCLLAVSSYGREKNSELSGDSFGKDTN